MVKGPGFFLLNRVRLRPALPPGPAALFNARHDKTRGDLPDRNRQR